MDFSFAEVLGALAVPFAAKEAVVDGERRFTWAQFDARTRGFAAFLARLGLHPRAERADLANHESGQHHLAIYLHNSAEFLEALVGATRARLAPFNVNYRYQAAELTYLLDDASPSVVVYEGAFAPVLAEVLPRLRRRPVLVQVDRGHGDLLPDAIPYEAAVAAHSALPEANGDDLYILYTGGTTGMPKGVLWRQADIFVTALGGRNFRGGGAEWSSVEDLVEAAIKRPGPRLLPAPPFMHGTGQWTALQALVAGGTAIIQPGATRFDPHTVLDTIERERVEVLVIVGDAFARPLVEALDGSDRHRDLSSLVAIVSSGAAVTSTTREAIARLLPHVKLKDVVGSSESGPQADAQEGRVFVPRPGTLVVSTDRARVLSPTGEAGEEGWLASSGRVPLGYLGDPAKTADTFPVIDGVRFSIPGDRARYVDDGAIEVLGRDSMTINTGGEKVFAEEVESVLCDHPAVADALVVGRPSERWGSEVVAVVQLTSATTDTELLAHCTDHLARYKAPKQIVFVDAVRRSPAGKPDYAWASEVARA